MDWQQLTTNVSFATFFSLHYAFSPNNERNCTGPTGRTEPNIYVFEIKNLVFPAKIGAPFNCSLSMWLNNAFYTTAHSEFIIKCIIRSDKNDSIRIFTISIHCALFWGRKNVALYEYASHRRTRFLPLSRYQHFILLIRYQVTSTNHNRLRNRFHTKHPIRITCKYIGCLQSFPLSAIILGFVNIFWKLLNKIRFFNKQESQSPLKPLFIVAAT